MSEKQRIKHYINGQYVDGTSERFSDVYDPAQGVVKKSTPLATKAEVEAAIASSQDAFPAWAATPAGRRAQVMFRYRELLIENMEELVVLLSEEHGKTSDDARGEITRGMEVVEFACGISELLKGDYTENVARGVDTYNTRQPLGVCAGITPFNFPAMVPMWMYPVAIVCGNTFVLKPSEKDPSVTVRLAELMTEAGLPDGVLNVINGDKEAVDTLLTDPRIKAVSFVGSTQIGEYIYKTGTANGKRVQSMCGAKNHMLVMPDADIDKAVDAIVGAAYGSAGERCMAISVVLTIDDTTADEIIEKLTPRVRDLKMGPYTDPASELGPLVTPEAQARVKAYIDAGVREGAELVYDGRDATVVGYETGCFVGGTIFDKVTKDMSIYKEEIFGPVLSIVRAKTYEEAVGLINDHEYGNGTAIFTRDGDAARDFSHKIQVGMVGINVPIPVPMAFHSFGGWKRSFFGDHAMHGKEGVRFFTAIKTVTTRWPSGIRSGAVFNFKAGGEH
jgi:malonate-semialdehyde dehydrogenase (acetylating)/methylmalonate-semialdehyde dehydrogenase